jgi:hypothetical protein
MIGLGSFCSIPDDSKFKQNIFRSGFHYLFIYSQVLIYPLHALLFLLFSKLPSLGDGVCVDTLDLRPVKTRLSKIVHGDASPPFFCSPVRSSVE